MPTRSTVTIRMNIETLEDRLALSTSSAAYVPISSVASPPSSVRTVLQQGTLTVLGTSASDFIRLRCKADRVSVDGHSYSSFKVKRVVIAAEGGSDIIQIDPYFRRPCHIFAGAGDDIVTSGRGNDVIYGDGGNDTLLGAGGNDVIFGGADTNALDGGKGANSLIDETPFQSDTPTSMATEVLRLINDERGRLGLKPLAFNTLLVEAADLQAGNMARHSEITTPEDALRHTLPGVAQPTLASRLDSVAFSARSASENIAYGYDTAAEVVEAWLNSPSHRNNILAPDATQTGIAARPNSEGLLFYCQVFASS
jgi:uncharacterized protein YkwD